MAILALNTGAAFAPTFITDDISVGADEGAYMGVWSYVDETTTPNDAACAGWTPIGRVTIGDTSFYPVGLTVLCRVGDFSGAQTITFGGQGQAYARWQIAKATDIDVMNLFAQVALAQRFPSARNQTLTATFDDLPAVTSQVLVFSGDWDLAAETIEASYSAVYNNQDGNMCTCAAWKRDVEDADAGVTVNANSNTWLGIVAIEIGAPVIPPPPGSAGKDPLGMMGFFGT
jgi:hypothetical protein